MKVKMKMLFALMLAFCGQSAHAVYVTEGEFLFDVLDGNTFLVERAVLTGMSKSGIKDARRFQDFVRQGQSGGALEATVKQAALIASCSGNGVTASIFGIKHYNYTTYVLKVQQGTGTYFRSINKRSSDNFSWHIESIENYGNDLESMSASNSGPPKDDVVSLSCVR